MFDFLRALVYAGIFVGIYSVLQVPPKDVDLPFFARLLASSFFQLYVLILAATFYGLEFVTSRYVRKASERVESAKDQKIETTVKENSEKGLEH